MSFLYFLTFLSIHAVCFSLVDDSKVIEMVFENKFDEARKEIEIIKQTQECTIDELNRLYLHIYVFERIYQAVLPSMTKRCENQSKDGNQ